jgi:hypothetical protein
MLDCLEGMFKYLKHMQDNLSYHKFNKIAKETLYVCKEGDIKKLYTEIYASTSVYAATMIITAYQESIPSKYAVTEVDDKFVLKLSKNESTVTNCRTCTVCSCFEFNSTLLPCKHIFFIRNHIGTKLFDKNMIPERWMIHNEEAVVNAKVTLRQRRSTVVSDVHKTTSATTITNSGIFKNPTDKG